MKKKFHQDNLAQLFIPFFKDKKHFFMCETKKGKLNVTVWAE